MCWRQKKQTIQPLLCDSLCIATQISLVCNMYPFNFQGFFVFLFFLLKCVCCLSFISPSTPVCDKCGSYRVCNIGQSLSFYGAVFL